MLGVSSLPQSPEDSAKQKAHADGIEEAHAIVLRHSPVCCTILLEDCVKLHHEGLRVFGVKFEGFGTLFWAAELVQKLVILPAAQSSINESVKSVSQSDLYSRVVSKMRLIGHPGLKAQVKLLGTHRGPLLQKDMSFEALIMFHADSSLQRISILPVRRCCSMEG